MSAPSTASTTASTTARSTAPVLELEHVTKRYGGVAALTDVSLRIRSGELVAIVGASGSGKSTLLHVMGTLDRPTSGRVILGDRPTDALDDRELSALRARRLGFVFQSSHLAEHTTALDDVRTALMYRGVPRRDRTAAALAALDRVGLAHRADHRPHELSGGERQRVGIARALVGSPSLVLADEPTGALDSVATGLVVDLLRRLHAEGTTIAVVTHDRDVASAFDRVVTMRDGRVLTDTGSAS